jgi:tetratricopeptide (TPR) repeat protein
MALALYDPCPCGSGKKLKFCCQSIADEMDRAFRLMDGNQPRVALHQLENLARKHPFNTWIDTTRALILIELNDPTTARDVLRALLEHHPEHEFAIVLLATAAFQADGLDGAKKAIHRAFQRGAKKFPSMVSGLAGTMASILSQRQRLFAAREHLALALRLSPEEHRQELFVHMLEFDGDSAIPYPLRGSHALPVVGGGTDEQLKEIRKAQKYAAVGCWNTAADLFLALTKSIPNSAELWHSIGLCRAWDGGEVSAAEALHQAAQLYGDFPAAVECETLAQLFDRVHTTDVIDICTYEAKVESIGRLLTLLDDQPRFLRLAIPNNKDAEDNSPVAAYQILDRAKWTGEDFSQLSLETMPRFQAHISIYDADTNSQEPPSLYLTGDRGADLDEARSLVESAAAGQLQWRTDKPQPGVTGAVAAESQPLRWRWSLPERTPIPLTRELKRQQWQRILTDTWPNAPQKCLGGQSPAGAAADPRQKVALTAATYVLDAQCHQQGYDLDLAGLLSRLGLEPVPPLDVDDSTQLGMLSVMQMHRLPVERLSDAQLIPVVNRALLTRHEGFLYRVLKVALSRPGCEAELDLPRSLRAMVELCAANGRRDEALHWVGVARSKPPADKSPFEYQWTWDMTELALRLEEPSDPELKPLLERFVHYYSPKVPQMRGYVENILATFGVPSPWDSVSIVTSTSVTAAVAGGVWTPDAPAPAAASPSKLWLPGS